VKASDREVTTMIQDPDDRTALRRRATESLKKRSEFRAHLLAYVLVNAFLVVIWAATGANFFWPVFPIAGWGIGLAFHAWDAYGNSTPTEEQVHREMERLARRDGR
jgi:hypothetical protein